MADDFYSHNFLFFLFFNILIKWSVNLNSFFCLFEVVFRFIWHLALCVFESTFSTININSNQKNFRFWNDQNFLVFTNMSSWIKQIERMIICSEIFYNFLNPKIMLQMFFSCLRRNFWFILKFKYSLCVFLVIWLEFGFWFSSNLWVDTLYGYPPVFMEVNLH